MIEVPTDQDWTLATERLVLEPMYARDAAELYALQVPPDSDAHAAKTLAPSLREVRARIRRWERRQSPDGAEVWLNWTLRLKDDQTVVGRMQATVTDQWADMAWVLGRHYWNRGYATEAGQCIAAWLLDFFNVDEIRATIHPENTASQRVATKVGMRRTGERTGDGEEVWACRP